VREIARKPYVIRDYMYSTSILKKDVKKLDEEGFLINTKWSEVTEVTSENKMKAGKELFTHQCLICHTVGGIKNDIIKRTEMFPYMGMVSQLEGQGKLNTYMPDFIGTE